VSTAAVALAVAAAATMLLFALRARRHALSLRDSVNTLQRELAAEHGRLDKRARQEREWLAVMAHELRSPVSAVLGYSELLADGTLGPLDTPASDALRRMHHAAEQLLRIIEGIDDLATDSTAAAAPVELVSARDLIEYAAAALRTDAEARRIQVIIEAADTTLSTRPDSAQRALTLALGAALKVSSGGTIRIAADEGPDAGIVITGSRLDPQRDDPDAARAAGAQLTGAGLRLILARNTAAHAGGALHLERAADDSTTLRLLLPAPSV
jgi:two-component system, cell cycle sensor histidine kinase PleC